MSKSSYTIVAKKFNSQFLLLYLRYIGEEGLAGWLAENVIWRVG